MYEYARTDMPISFPGLFGEWSINPDPVAIPIGNGIRWYGIIICEIGRASCRERV